MLGRNGFLNVLTKQVLATLLLSKVRHGNFFMGKNRLIKNGIPLHSYNLESFMEKAKSFFSCC